MAKSKRNLVIFLLASLVFLITALSPCLILSAGASQPVRGDINHNGRLDAKDAMLIQRFTISLSTFTADDYKTADKLAAEHLIYLYNKVSPIIEAARESAKGKHTYIHFEKLVNRLQASNPEIKLYHKNAKGES